MITLKLKSPIKYGTQEITELEIREPKAKDMRSMPGTPSTGDLLNLLGKLSGQAASVIDELGIKDMEAALEHVSSFFGDGPTTGA